MVRAVRPATWFLLLTALLFGWAGLVAGISFLEAPLKFTAPHITVALGRAGCALSASDQVRVAVTKSGRGGEPADSVMTS